MPGQSVADKRLSVRFSCHSAKSLLSPSQNPSSGLIHTDSSGYSRIQLKISTHHPLKQPPWIYTYNFYESIIFILLRQICVFCQKQYMKDNMIQCFNMLFQFLMHIIHCFYIKYNDVLQYKVRCNLNHVNTSSEPVDSYFYKQRY